MTASELLADIAERGVIIRADGGQLEVDAPPGCLTNEDWETLGDRKSEILELLTLGNPETHDSALFDGPPAVCPVCSSPTAQESGDRFLWTGCRAKARHFVECRITTIPAAGEGGRKQ